MRNSKLRWRSIYQGLQFGTVSLGAGWLERQPTTEAEGTHGWLANYFFQDTCWVLELEGRWEEEREGEKDEIASTPS